jgi:hypothetical protein
MRLGFGVTILARSLQAGGVDGIGSDTRELLKRFLGKEELQVVPISYGVHVADIQIIKRKILI